MSLFEKKQRLTRDELRRALRKASPTIPGSGGRMFSRGERLKMEREIFGKEMGEYITEDEYKKALGKLRVKKYQAKTGKERLQVDRKIRFLRKLGGL